MRAFTIALTCTLLAARAEASAPELASPAAAQVALPAQLPATIPAPAPDVAALVQARVDEERAHLTRLGIWALGNVVAGSGLLLLARPETSPLPAPATVLEGVAIQSLAWGAINLAIVGLGFAIPPSLPTTRDGALAAEGDLGNALWLNVGLDGGYMMAGGAMIAAASQGASPTEAWASHGAGVVVQGLGLAVLDVIAVWSSDPRQKALQGLPRDGAP